MHPFFCNHHSDYCSISHIVVTSYILNIVVRLNWITSNWNEVIWTKQWSVNVLWQAEPSNMKQSGPQFCLLGDAVDTTVSDALFPPLHPSLVYRLLPLTAFCLPSSHSWPPQPSPLAVLLQAVPLGMSTEGSAGTGPPDLKRCSEQKVSFTVFSMFSGTELFFSSLFLNVLINMVFGETLFWHDTEANFTCQWAWHKNSDSEAKFHMQINCSIFPVRLRVCVCLYTQLRERKISLLFGCN